MTKLNRRQFLTAASVAAGSLAINTPKIMGMDLSRVNLPLRQRQCSICPREALRMPASS
jgi:hypothetical protein